jgi:hypothetical protein
MHRPDIYTKSRHPLPTSNRPTPSEAFRMDVRGMPLSFAWPDQPPFDRGPVKASRGTKLFLAPAACPAHAQAGRPDWGLHRVEPDATSDAGHARDGHDAGGGDAQRGDYRVRLPPSGLSVPADGAVNAIARPLVGGLRDITAITFPSGGTVETAIANAGTSRIVFLIGGGPCTGRSIFRAALVVHRQAWRRQILLGTGRSAQRAGCWPLHLGRNAIARVPVEFRLPLQGNGLAPDRTCAERRRDRQRRAEPLRRRRPVSPSLVLFARRVIA